MWKLLLPTLLLATLIGVPAPLTQPASADLAHALPLPPPLCPPPSRADQSFNMAAGCRVDGRYAVDKGVQSWSRAELSISAPQVLVVGQQFTMSVSSGFPRVTCRSVHREDNCFDDWWVGLRPASSAAAGAPFIGPHSLDACPGIAVAYGPFAGAGLAGNLDPAMKCSTSVQLPISPNPGGQWWLLGVEIEGGLDGAAVFEALEVPVEVVRPGRQALVVNSTGTTLDEAEVHEDDCDVTPAQATPTCTLAQAIAISNSTGGRDIDFDIPHGHGNTFDGSDPEILYGRTGGIFQELDGYEILAPTTIDGSTQPGSGRVELAGPYPSRVALPSSNPGFSEFAKDVNAGLSLYFGSEGSVIRGMVIDGFPYQIALYAKDVTVERCYLGIEPAHGLGAPLNDADSLGIVGIFAGGSHDTIGTPGNGNVIAGEPGRNPEQDPEASGALRRAWGEYGIGLGAAVRDKAEYRGEHAGHEDSFEANTFVGAGDVYDLDLVGSNDQIGGAESGAGNTFDGGASVLGDSAVVQGNTFGGESGDGTVWTGAGSTIGGQTPTPGTGAGNVFDLHSGFESLGTDCASRDVADAAAPRRNGEDRTALVPGKGSVVQGNLFTGGCYDIGVSVEAPGITIGGSSADLGNEFQGFTSPSPDVARFYAPLAVGGIRPVTAITDPEGNIALQVAHPPDGDTVSENTFSANIGNAAVDVYQGSGITIYANRMVGNSAGIILGANGYVLDGDALYVKIE